MNNSVSYGASNHSVNHSFISFSIHISYFATLTVNYIKPALRVALTLIDFPALRLNRCVAMRINLRRWNRAFA
jgi:hypothetical protein